MSTTETKTEAKTSTANTTATAAGHSIPNPFQPFVAAFGNIDPMTMWTTSQQTFHKLVTDAIAQAESFASQFAAMETQMIGKAQGVVANWAQLAQDALAYGARLSAEARKLGLETARQAAAKTNVNA